MNVSRAICSLNRDDLAYKSSTLFHGVKQRLLHLCAKGCGEEVDQVGGAKNKQNDKTKKSGQLLNAKLSCIWSSAARSRSPVEGWGPPVST